MRALRTAPARWAAVAALLIGPAAHAAAPPDPVLRGADRRKLKHAHFGYVGSLLHFRFVPGPADRRYVPRRRPAGSGGAVAVDGEPWADLHAEERSVWLPASSRARHVAVTLVPPPRGPAASEARKE